MNESYFNNKTCLITGGTQSIGKATASMLHSLGSNVIITGRKSQQQGESIANDIGSNCQYITLDVTNTNHWQSLADTLNQSKRRLDIVVNNAGIEYANNADPAQQNPEVCSLDDWQAVFATNVDGLLLGCQFAIKQLKPHGGAIVNIGSRSGLVGIPASAAYAASKAAVTNLTKSVALHCVNNHYNIRCNIIHPAAIDTHMWDKELGCDDLRDKRKADFAKNIPMGRMGTSDEIAQAVIFFASDNASFITGTELIVDGGIMAGTAAGAFNPQ
ncbi:MAG: SDR family oxidoreductase [Coxiellaceae bacterium]|nr:SDR family oxidoreductase [Coxiellaceae bacterium]